MVTARACSQCGGQGCTHCAGEGITPVLSLRMPTSLIEGAMRLLEQAADTIALDRGRETTGTGKLRTCAGQLRAHLPK